MRELFIRCPPIARLPPRGGMLWPPGNGNRKGARHDAADRRRQHAGRGRDQAAADGGSDPREPQCHHLPPRCGDACSCEAPNQSDAGYFRDIANKAINRRALIGTCVAVTGLSVIATEAPTAARGKVHPPRPFGLRFKPVPATVDDVSVPAGYRWDRSSGGATRS